MNAGYSKTYAWKALTRTPPTRLAKKLQEQAQKEGESRARQYLESCWSKAEKFVTQNPPGNFRHGVDHEIDFARDVIENHPWKGKAGSTDRAVVGSHLDIAAEIGSTRWSASARQIAEATGIRHQTVIRSHARLQGLDFLRLILRGCGQDASDWALGGALRPNADKRTTNTHTPPGVVPSGANLRAGEDASRWGALGLTAVRVHKELAKGPGTPGEIAKRTGLHISTACRILNKLDDAKLAFRETVKGKQGYRWHPADATEHKLEEVAKAYGTSGDGARQTIHHKEERETYRESRRLRREWRKEQAEQGKSSHQSDSREVLRGRASARES